MTMQAHSIPYKKVIPPPNSFAGLVKDAGVSVVVSSLAPGFSEKIKQESNSLKSFLIILVKVNGGSF